MAESKLYPPLPISQRVHGIPEALSIYVNQLVYDLVRKGRNMIVLSLGEAYFNVPWFGFEGIDLDKGNHYSDSRGIPELRAKLAEFYCRAYGAHVDPARELLVTAGSKFAIFMAMQTALEPGDEVAFHEPAWLSYQEQARLVGAVPVFIPYDQPVPDFPRFLTPRTKMLVLNNPNNPAGRVYGAAELAALYEQCRDRGIYLLVDEAYSDFLVGDGFDSLAVTAPERHGAIVVEFTLEEHGHLGLANRLFNRGSGLRRSMPQGEPASNYLRTNHSAILPRASLRRDNRGDRATGTRGGAEARAHRKNHG